MALVSEIGVNRIDAFYCSCSPKGGPRSSPSLPAKTFRGELVPTEAELARREGRSYEPASALLERIRAERESSAGSSRERAASLLEGR